MTFSEDFFWNQVSGDHETQRKSAALVHGKVAAATWWPFLSHATSEPEFEDRLSLVSNKIESAVQPEVYEDVISSLRDDFRAVHEASRNSAQSTSPELADLNTGLASHRADLTSYEFYNAGAGTWVTATRHEDGSTSWVPKEAKAPAGQPIQEWHETNPNARDYSYHKHFVCKDHPKAQFTSKNPYDRSVFLKPGAEDCGDPISHFLYTGSEKDGQKEATNYQPDPNAAWRYHQPYQNIDGAGQVNNGNLQDADGFPVDLAQGEYDAAAQRMQFQLTPGQWTEHDAMPERPMPQGVARGYQSVASQHESGMDFRKMINGSDEAETALDPHYNEVPEIRGTSRTKGTFDGPTGRELADAEKLKSQKSSAFHFDAQGFLVEADRSDHVGWASSYYDLGRRHATEGKQPNMQGFRENDKYRAAYTDGYNNGGYAGQHRQASDVAQEGVRGRAVEPLRDPAPGTTQRVNPYYFNDDAAMGANEGFPAQPTEDPADRANEYGDVPPQQSGGSTQGTSDGNGYSRSYPGQSPDFSSGGKTAAWWDDEHKFTRHDETPGDDVPYELKGTHSPARHFTPEEAADIDTRWGINDYPGSDAKPEHDWDKGPEHHNQAGRTASNTDGKIVDHCPGCNVPRRVHATPHGDEIRHLHNNHVRCHGAKTAVEESDSLPQFFDPSLSNGSVHTADYLGRPDTNNLNGRGDNAFDAKNWEKLRERSPVQPLEGEGGMNPNSRDDGIRAHTTPEHDQRGVPGRRAEPGDDEAEDEDE